MSVPTHTPPRCKHCSALLAPPGHSCASCGREQANEYFPPGFAAGPAKSVGVAVLLSFFWFGAGHLYANQVGLGVPLVIYSAFLGLLAITGIGLIIAIPLWLISAPIVMLTAASAANGFNRRNGITVR